MAIKKASSLSSGGTFFKPGDHGDALAILFEPKSIRRDVPNTYQGVTKNRDEVTADITIFRTQDHIAGKRSPEVITGAIVVHGAICSALEEVMGEATIGVVRKIQGKTGNTYWGLKDPADDVFAKVEGWYSEKEAALQKAMDEAPGFDD